MELSVHFFVHTTRCEQKLGGKGNYEKRLNYKLHKCWRRKLPDCEIMYCMKSDLEKKAVFLLFKISGNMSG